MSEEDKHKLSKILYYSDIHPADAEFINNIIYDLQQENKQLKVKSDVLEENNKLLIQQKAQMYEDLDIAYEKIDKATKYIKQYSNTNYLDFRQCEIIELLEILGDKENEHI